MRLSFCCSVEGCRRRATPPSLRFLGRKVFFGALVLLLPVLREGPTPERLRRLAETFAVSPRTLLRWRRWWRAVVPLSRFWESMRGRFAVPVATEALPGSLLMAFSARAQSRELVVSVLHWLSPLPSELGRGL
jgi:predicted DNA-binding transcriptional regulator YafY